MSQLTRHWKVAPPTLAELEKLTPLTTPKNSNIFSTITSLRFIALIISLFSLQVLASNVKDSIPDFKSLEGNWEFSTKWTSPYSVYGEKKTGIIKVDFIDNYSLKGEVNCQAITLNIVDEKLLTSVVGCAGDQYFLCAGYIDDCGLPVDLGYEEVYTNVTKRKENTLILHPEYKETRYILELTPDKLIYRYQEKDCFISYPHGCLINAFSWHDIGRYEMEKVNNINNKELN